MIGNFVGWSDRMDYHDLELLRFQRVTNEEMTENWTMY
jgi:hypothetical protein